MTIQEMHYDVKKKLNKVDSQRYRNLKVPEIDWCLNEAADIIVKRIAVPRSKDNEGFETSQRTIDDIRTLVVNTSIVTIFADVIFLPADYQHFLECYVNIKKGNCEKKVRVSIKQHDDEFRESPFDDSSFEWGVCNGRFFQNGIRLFPNNFTVESVSEFSYIKKLTYFHYAAGYNGGTYKLPNGTTLAGFVNCELPFHLHREIVDIAVLVLTGELQIPDYNIKMNKINLLN